MSTLDQIRQGLHRAWDGLSEGWHELRDRTAHALTRFSPAHRHDVETAEQQLEQGSSRWGLLAAEVREEDDAVVVRLEVPGMERDGFDISVVDGRVLVVRGEKRVQRQESHGRFYVMEAAYGRFERALPLPSEVDESQARASYKRGVLRVDLPKTRREPLRRIPIQNN